MSGDWHDDWQAAGALQSDPAALVRAFRREQRRLVIAFVAELAVLGGLLGLAGFALLRGPQISDTLWAGGVGLFLSLVAGAILISRRTPLPLAQRATHEFLAALVTSSQRRLQLLRWAWVVLVLGTLGLLPFAVWRYSVNTIPLTSHHGAFSAAATAVLVIGAAFWIRYSQRRTREELELARGSLEQATARD
jgi:hypothetical protein